MNSKSNDARSAVIDRRYNKPVYGLGVAGAGGGVSDGGAMMILNLVMTSCHAHKYLIVLRIPITPVALSSVNITV